MKFKLKKKGLDSMLYINHQFKLIMTHSNSESERVEFYSNTAYDVRVRYESDTITDVVAWAKTKQHEYLPNLTAIYREDHGIWETMINYHPYELLKATTDQSSYLAKYTLDSSLGESSSRALTELLNALELRLEEKTRQDFQTAILSKQALNSMLKLYKEEIDGTWE